MFYREVISASTKVQQRRDQVLALDIAYRGKQSLEQEIRSIRTKSAELLKSSQALKRVSVKLANSILLECVLIGDKSRMQLSKQITQQLSELSTETAADFPNTPISRELMSQFQDSDIDHNQSGKYFPMTQSMHLDNVWKVSTNNFHTKLGKSAHSFSMMFPGN